MPLADLIVIADGDGSHNPWSATLVKDFSRARREAHKHRGVARTKKITAARISPSESAPIRQFHTIPTRFSYREPVKETAEKVGFGSESDVAA
jgi:hypothetical protein